MGSKCRMPERPASDNKPPGTSPYRQIIRRRVKASLCRPPHDHCRASSSAFTIFLQLRFQHSQTSHQLTVQQRAAVTNFLLVTVDIVPRIRRDAVRQSKLPSSGQVIGAKSHSSAQEFTTVIPRKTTILSSFAVTYTALIVNSLQSSYRTKQLHVFVK